jgi:hypothetical protein
MIYLDLAPEIQRLTPAKQLRLLAEISQSLASGQWPLAASVGPLPARGGLSRVADSLPTEEACEKL